MLTWGMAKLGLAFPASFPDEGATGERIALWRELLDTHPWITPEAFRRGVNRMCWEHKGDFLPGPAVALDFFSVAVKEVRRETEKALSPPAPVADAEWAQKDGPQRAAFLERHLAIGKLRARAGVSLTDYEGNLVPFAPTEQEIAGVIGQMRAQRFLSGALQRIADGEVLTPAELAAASADRRRGLRPITDEEAAAAHARRDERG